jgi:hypothetical protein
MKPNATTFGRDGTYNAWPRTSDLAPALVFGDFLVDISVARPRLGRLLDAR